MELWKLHESEVDSHIRLYCFIAKLEMEKIEEATVERSFVVDFAMRQHGSKIVITVLLGLETLILNQCH